MKPLKIILLISLIGLGSRTYADYGCHFIVNSRLATIIDSPEKKLSFRFTCQEDMNVIALSLFCQEAQAPPAYQISIQEDENGKPSSKPLETSSVTPKGGGWVTIPIDEVPLFGGKIYHLVVEQDVMRGGQHPVGVIGPNNFASFAYTDLLNFFYPNSEKPDPKTNVLLFEKGQWKALDREPLYAIHGSGQMLQGNPYDDFGVRPIHGNGTPGDPSDDVIQGEALHPHYDLNPKGFVIRVKKQGNPDSPLNYRVYVIDHMHHKTHLAFSGEALKPGQTPGSFQWVTIGIKKDDNPEYFPPECRYVVFQTNSGKAVPGSPGCEDCYLLSDVGNSGGLSGAPDLTFDGGAHLARAVHSMDGWATWIDEFERDAHVIIQGLPATPLLAKPVNPIPTPLPLSRSFIP